MKKFTRVIFYATAAACLITACGKKPSTPHVGAAMPGKPNTNKEIPTTTSNIRVHISDITAYAGEEIDYISAIQSAENMEIKRSMIYVDSSAVDNNTPGIYLAEYSFDYLGETVTSSIKVTILANPNATTAAVPEETTTAQPATEEATADPSGETAPGETAATEGESSAGGENQPDDPEHATEPATQTPLSTEPVRATVEQMLPDATITLSNGKVVTVKCTSSRYIVETFTDESYFKEDGFTFLTSELKVLFNTGEIQVIETVVTRVEPQTAAEAETPESTT